MTADSMGWRLIIQKTKQIIKRMEKIIMITTEIQEKNLVGS